MKHFNAPAQGFRKRFRANRHNHEFLKVNVVVGMGAAIEDIHHGHGKDICGCAAKITKQRKLVASCHGASSRHGNRENGICAESAFVFCAVEFDHFLIEATLIGGIEVGESVANFAVHILYRFEYALAQITVIVTVAEFDRFMFARGCAAGDNGAAMRAIDEGDFGLYCGIPA